MNILKLLGEYRFFNELEIVEKLEPRNYYLSFGKDIYLSEAPAFQLPKKIYDRSRDFRGRIKKAFFHYPKNTGVLLSGKKGQGKSLVAKMICQEMGLPVIIIKGKISKEADFIGFLGAIKQDFVLFVDEFEKIFSLHGDTDDPFHDQEKFLSFMDGAVPREAKILFLLTANENINTYLINRPSRVRFSKKYNEMDPFVMEEIIEDLLVNKAHKKDLIENISSMVINVDLLISIIEDMNLFGLPFSEFKKEYNYKEHVYVYDVYKVIDKKETLIDQIHTSSEIKGHEHRLAGYNVLCMLKHTEDEVEFATSWENYEALDENGDATKVKGNILLRLKKDVI